MAGEAGIGPGSGMEARVRGALLGLACGDALGAPAEFHDRAWMRENHGRLTEMVGGGMWAPGEWTDDTAMALAVAEGILECPEDPMPPTGERFLAWLRSRPKDVGATIRAALAGFHGDWAEASRGTSQARTGKAAGNGSLMRTLPVALAYPDAGEMATASARLSAMTHWDPQAEVCCSVYNLWVRRLLAGEPRGEAWRASVRDAQAVAARGPLSPDTPGPAPLPVGLWGRLGDVEALTYDTLQPSGYAGYAVECLEAAAWCVLNADTLEDALVNAVNLAGEADTIAAVAGGAAGAHWGADAIPSRWLAALHGRDRLETAAGGLSSLRRHSEVYATPGLPPFACALVGERLYAGRNPLTARDAARMASLGVTHVLDLRGRHEWEAPGKFGAEALVALKTLGIERRSLPVADLGPPTAADFDAAWECLGGWLAEPGAVAYVHCRAGRERTAAIVGAVCARRDGTSFDAALRTLRAGGWALEPLPVQQEAARRWLGE